MIGEIDEDNEVYEDEEWKGKSLLIWYFLFEFK
jgi:hypothetical protein